MMAKTGPSRGCVCFYGREAWGMKSHPRLLPRKEPGSLGEEVPPWAVAKKVKLACVSRSARGRVCFYARGAGKPG
ncbi:hypothetical protein NDU88_003334 [Pleurodeles waltl]|uniref:Uncharacterized protein n=1 Tax=Pleurodeles waltl TaxID=8319 RepID=A0AAV7LIA2_PLEWA|nr:hypothetical protein NDU88_003334 [Pleurodeles waltl]